MSAALALQFIDGTRRRSIKEYAVTFSGSYTAGGDTISFKAATNPNNEENANWGRMPTSYAVKNFPAGYKAEIIPGTTLANWKLKIWDNAAGTELAASSYPGALTGATDVRLEFSGNNLV